MKILIALTIIFITFSQFTSCRKTPHKIPQGALEPFHVGEADEHGLYGYMDSTGTIIIEPKYYDARSFSEGIAWVAVAARDTTLFHSDEDEVIYEWKAIDSSGQFLFEKSFYDVQDFNNGRGWVCESYEVSQVSRYSTFGVNTSFRPQLTMGLPGPASYALRGTHWGLIDQSGRYLIDPKCDRVGRWESQVQCAFVNVEGKWGLVGRNGEFLLKPMFDGVLNFSDRFAPVNKGGREIKNWIKGGLWGWINLQGHIIVKPKFDNLGTFHDGITECEVDKKWGIVDTSGKILVEPRFNDLPDLIKYENEKFHVTPLKRIY